MFDPQRSYPFAQFMNKQQLNEIKAQAKLHLIQHSLVMGGPLADMRRRSSIKVGMFNLASNQKLGRRISIQAFLTEGLGDSNLLRRSDSLSVLKKLKN